MPYDSLRIHRRRYPKRKMRTILAVASSVSMERSFDVLDALAYAVENNFKGLQIFMNERMVNDVALRESVRSLCESSSLALVAHAPATLSKFNLLQNPVDSAAMDLFAPNSRILLVHHYDETVTVEESLECLQFLHDRGITTCLENYFALGADTSESCFNEYLQLIIEAETRDLGIVPVLDIARLYHARVNLRRTALILLNRLFEMLASIKIPIILHLIDVKSDSQERRFWCPIGQGIIPYSEIFGQLVRRKVSVHMVVLEYEDKVNP